MAQPYRAPRRMTVWTLAVCPQCLLSYACTHRAPCHTVRQVVAKEEGLRTEQSMRIQLEASVSKK